MTREEAIKILKYNSNVIHKTINGETDPNEVEALDMAIKALEWEDVLGKIRGEIEQAADKQFRIAMGVADLNERYTHIQMENAYRHSINILDKYKAESEGKECK